MNHIIMSALVATTLLTMSGCDSVGSNNSSESEVVHNPFELKDNTEYNLTIHPGESIFILWNEKNCNKASHRKIDESIWGHWYTGWIQIYRAPSQVLVRDPPRDAIIQVNNPTDSVVETTWVSLTPGTHNKTVNFTCPHS